MTATRQSGRRQPSTEFANSRATAERERSDQQSRAVRTVARQSRDRHEFVGLLSMLGLDEVPGGSLVLGPMLGGYIRQVAAAVGVPAEATGYEVSDTATAYLGLSQRWPERPEHDLMLVWDERLGWYVGVETVPGEAPVVIAYLGGAAVPVPATVARFVADAVAGRHVHHIRPVLPPADRASLANQMAAIGAEPDRADR
ncbi:MAG: hypothetical protein GEV28_30880 [Actinophytocola sp.]|uniref:DUF6292 family protein n=1 Tax=Actinophytocola sp. TaxID=1872138 RepID=UPI0013269B3B|nr:DUF6292 family protein [Actinophytocola sp.]MPZ84555.1 hypothetical protein [Actinophytocola sp.]